VSIKKTRYAQLYEDEVIDSNGQRKKYTYLHNRPFVVIVACRNGKFILVKQYRYVLAKSLIEFPSGGIEEGEIPIDAAKRELEHETGYTSDSWEELGHIVESVGTVKSEGTVYLVEDAKNTGNKNWNEEYIEKILSYTSSDLEHLISSGQIIDSTTIAAYFLAKNHLTQKI
jgi:ADP-ribose pyrophosphatase